MGSLSRLRQLLRRGLEETAALWPAVREAYLWVKRVARVLKNEEKLPAKGVRRRLVQSLVRMRRAAATTGEPSVKAGLKQFLKVTKSYWPGLFGCYDSADLPRTNNDLEQTFGSHRYHERRSSGRRRASPGLVVMGSARVISGLATRLRRRKAWCCGRAMWRTGRSCARSWRRGASRGGSSTASARIQPPISQSWSNSVSS